MLLSSFLLFVIAIWFNLLAARSEEDMKGDKGASLLLAIIFGILALIAARASGFGIPKGSWRMSGDGQIVKVIAVGTNYDGTIIVFARAPSGKFGTYEFPSNDIVKLSLDQYHSAFQKSPIKGVKIMPVQEIDKPEKGP